jgi:hypothetical protein
METELKSLQDKIFDLESKLNVSNQPVLPARPANKGPLSKSSSHSSLEGHSSFTNQQSKAFDNRPDSILATKSDTTLKHFGLPSDRRVKIKDTPEYEKKGTSKEEKKKRLKVDINLNNLSSTHHIEGGGSISTEEDRMSMKSGVSGNHSRKASISKGLKRGSCSP